MDKEMVKVFYGSFFHDIGKGLQRTRNYGWKKHSKIGADFLKSYTDDKDIINSVAYHHKDEINSTRSLADDSLSFITYIADNIASATDRKKKDLSEKKTNWEKSVALYDIFNRYGQTLTSRCIKPGELHIDKLENMMPTNSNFIYSSSDYTRGIEYFKRGLVAVSLTEEYIPSVLNLLEATMSFMPSSTDVNEEVDISLFDHMKLTAAYACAIKQYLDDNKITDYRNELFKNTQKFYKKQAFALVGFDLKGIEDFIYTITSKAAHKQLRSRAFYAEMLTQNFLDTLLEALGLSEANILYASADHGYIIMGNTAENKEIVRKVQKAFNDFLLENFGIKLYLTIGYTTFSSSQVTESASSKEYARIFREVDDMLKKNDMNRYTAEDLIKMNAFQGDGRECAVCHTVSNLAEGKNKCILCEKLENFSSDIQNQDYFIINDNPQGLPVGQGLYLNTTNEEKIKSQAELYGKVYSKNQLNTGMLLGKYLWVSDFSETPNNDYSRYAQRPWSLENNQVIGIKRMAALMIDVDDLYAGYLAGFQAQENGRFTAMSRYATLSRRLSIFFKLFVNDCAKDYHVSIIYSQGDDIFLLGAWDDVLSFTAKLYKAFENWTAGEMTFSAGVGLVPDKTPINIIARETKQLLKKSKHAGKDRITLFALDNTFTFDDFINDINGKLTIIRTFFNSEDEHGKAFIYKLLDLISQRDRKDRIAFARLAYFLTRLENASQSKENFSAFKKQMVSWFNSAEEIRKVEMALMLYVYEIRKEN